MFLDGIISLLKLLVLVYHPSYLSSLEFLGQLDLVILGWVRVDIFYTSNIWVRLAFCRDEHVRQPTKMTRSAEGQNFELCGGIF